MIFRCRDRERGKKIVLKIKPEEHRRRVVAEVGALVERNYFFSLRANLCLYIIVEKGERALFMGF